MLLLLCYYGNYLLPLFCQLSKIPNLILLKLLLADCISIHCNQQCDLYKPWVVCTRFLIIWGLAHTEGKFFCTFIMKICINMSLSFIVSVCVSACHGLCKNVCKLWHWTVLLMSVDKFQFRLNSGDSDRHLAWRCMATLTGNNKINMPEILFCACISKSV